MFSIRTKKFRCEKKIPFRILRLGSSLGYLCTNSLWLFKSFVQRVCHFMESWSQCWLPKKAFNSARAQKPQSAFTSFLASASFSDIYLLVLYNIHMFCTFRYTRTYLYSTIFTCYVLYGAFIKQTVLFMELTNWEHYFFSPCWFFQD